MQKFEESMSSSSMVSMPLENKEKLHRAFNNKKTDSSAAARSMICLKKVYKNFRSSLIKILRLVWKFLKQETMEKNKKYATQNLH